MRLSALGECGLSDRSGLGCVRVSKLLFFSLYPPPAPFLSPSLFAISQHSSNMLTYCDRVSTAYLLQHSSNVLTRTVNV